VLRLVLAALAALFVLPATAPASLRATVDADGTLRVSGTDLADHVEVRDGASAGDVELRDPTGTETADTGCVAGPGVVTCSGAKTISVVLAEGDDVLGLASGDAVLRLDTALKVMVNGGAGDDELRGGRGDDQLFGEEGADELDGDEGADLVSGLAGRDSLRGGAGKDALFTRDGEVDTIDCGDDTDTLQADRQEPAGNCEAVAPIVDGLAIQPAGALFTGMVLTPSPSVVDGSPSRASYAWFRCDAAGNGCTNVASTDEYTTTGADIGFTFRVQISVVNDAGFAGMISPPSAPVQARTFPPAPNPIDFLAAKVIAVAKPKVSRGPKGYTVDTGIRGTCRAAVAPCTITLTARTVKAKRLKTIVAGTGRQVVAAGRSARLKFALRKDGAARLLRDKRLKLVLSVRVTQAGAKTVSQQMPLTLRAPR
jgi:hypothetical protein